MEIPRYIGQNSIPAILRDQPSPIDTKNGIDIRRDMRPIWGLDNSAPFPLMSTYHLDKMTQEISVELPSDREVLKYVSLGACKLRLTRRLQVIQVLQGSTTSLLGLRN